MDTTPISPTERLQEILKLLDTPSRKEFIDAFKKVTDYVKRVDERTASEVQALEQTLTEKYKSLTEDNGASFDAFKEEARAMAEDVLQRAQARIETKLLTIHDGAQGPQGETGIQGPQGEQGERGNDGSPDTGDEIIQKINAATGFIARSAIDGLDDDLKALRESLKSGSTQTGWGAHPLNIYQSSVVKAKTARHLNFTGATVTHGKDGVTTIAVTGGGAGTSFETPVGSVNSSNTTFTVLNTPKFIIIDGATYFENNGYSLSGLTITTVVPPTGFIMSAY